MLDELNSMSLEPQGTPLRFLENAEITPIGGYKDEMLVNGKAGKEIHKPLIDFLKENHKFFSDFLIVGIMNEDPEEITREEAIRFLQRERDVGGLLSDLLYEHILKIRRLRPDLRARMMRNGKLEIPKLAEHRADIPVSFYMFINKEKRDYFPNSKIRITMDSLELLMSSELEWTENFRLLQTLTKKIVEIIYEDYENKKEELIIIRENHIRKAMEAIGMIKESKKDDK